MLTIITCVYNNLEVCKVSIDSIISNTDVPFKLILVNNYSFDSRVPSFLKEVYDEKDSNISVVDPGKNLGCHRGWNFGFNFRDKSFPFCAKIDDDVVVPQNWASKIIAALKSWSDFYDSKIALLGSDLDCRPNIKGKEFKVGGFTFEEPTPIVGFSCVVFPTSVVLEFGPMKGRGFYGHEESYYLKCAKNRDYRAFWLKDVLAHHVETKLKNWNYIVWKLSYGFFGITGKDYESFVDSEDLKKGWIKLLQYYSRTKREDLRRDEDPEKALEAFREEVKTRDWDVSDL